MTKDRSESLARARARLEEMERDRSKVREMEADLLALTALENRFKEAQDAIEKATGKRPKTWDDVLEAIRLLGQDRDDARRAWCKLGAYQQNKADHGVHPLSAFDIAARRWGEAEAIRLLGGR